MNPIMIIPPELIKSEDIKLLRDNGICVVEAADPAKVRFLDPIPSMSSRTEIDNAAIHLSRILLNQTWGDYSTSSSLNRYDFTRIFVDLLVKGTSLDRNGSLEEQQQRIFDAEKRSELSRLARQEAKEERRQAREAKLQKKTQEKKPQ